MAGEKLGKAVCVHAMFTRHAQKRTLPAAPADGLGRVDPLQAEHGGSCWRKTGPGRRSRSQGPRPCSVPRLLVPGSRGLVPERHSPRQGGRGNGKLAPPRAPLGRLTTSQMAEATHIWGAGELLRAVR